MLSLSSDRWKYLHFAAGRPFTHSPLRYIYVHLRQCRIQTLPLLSTDYSISEAFLHVGLSIENSVGEFSIRTKQLSALSKMTN